MHLPICILLIFCYYFIIIFVDNFHEECRDETITKCPDIPIKKCQKCKPKFGEHLVGSRVIVMTKEVCEEFSYGDCQTSSPNERCNCVELMNKECHTVVEKKCVEVPHETCIDVPVQHAKPITKNVCGYNFLDGHAEMEDWMMF